MTHSAQLIARWKDDAGGTCRSWFLWEQRIKNFRSIRAGIAEVVRESDGGTFGNVYTPRALRGHGKETNT